MPTSARLALLLAAVAAASTADAGVDRWTTNGPRATWSVEWHDPVDPSRVFVGLRGKKAIYRSQDGGRTFRLALAIPSFNGSINTIVTPGITSFASNPAAPDELLAGDDWNTVYRSTDGGVTWNAWAGLGSVRRIDFDPWGHGDVFVTTASGLHVKRSTAPTFAAPLFAWDAALVPARSGTVVLFDADGAARSLDAGATWSRLPGIAPNPIASVAVSRADGLRLYAIAGISSGGPGAVVSGRVYRSDDAGDTWAPLASLPNVPAPRHWMPDPTRRDRVWVLATSDGSPFTLMRSDDGGASFAPVGVPGGAPAAFGIDAASGSLCLTNDAGFLCTPDGGAHWRAVETDMPGDGIDAYALGSLWVDLVASRGQPGHVASLKLGRTQAFGAQAWSALTGAPTAPIGDEGRMLGARTVYDATAAANVTTIRSTDDGGVTWSDLRTLPSPSGSCYLLAVAPSDAARMVLYAPLYFYTFNLFTPGCLAASDDAGATFDDLDPGFGPTKVGAANVVFDPGDARVAWSAQGGNLSRSGDGGFTWQGVSAFPLQKSPRSISIDPADGRRLAVATLGEGVGTTQDAGATWSFAKPTAGTVAADVDWGATPARIYAGNADGVWTMPWGGTTWERVPGSEGWQVNDVKVVVPKNASRRATVVAATSRGVWMFTPSAWLPIVAVFRFFNTQTGAHFYTASAAERDHVIATWPQFVYEGERFRVLSGAAAGSVPVYRFFNTQTGVHFYTDDEAERDHVIATWPQFAFEGVAFHAFRRDPGTVAVRRYFNTATGTHFYTTSADEALTVGQNYAQFVDEGLRWAVYPSPRDDAAP
jgi:hypothetical protein